MVIVLRDATPDDEKPALHRQAFRFVAQGFFG
jgi:hypothetical protein